MNSNLSDEKNTDFEAVGMNIRQQLSVNKKKIIVVLAIVAVLLIIGSCYNCATSISNANTYDNAISLIELKQYDEALSMLDTLDDTYKDNENIKKYLEVVLFFDKNDKENYNSTIDSLNELGSFDDEHMTKNYNEFKSSVTKLENEYKNLLSKANVITDKIDSIDDVSDLQLKDKDIIKKIREEYNNSSKEIQELVANISVLDDAEDRIELLEEYKKDAKAVSKKIKNIGTVTLSSKGLIDSAEKAYNNLPAEAKEYVNNYSKLEKAQDRYNYLQKEKKKQEEAQRRALTSKSSTTSGSSQTVEEYGTVYWTPNGSVYHTNSNCPTLARSSTIYSGSISASGMPRACKVCS